jgi:hypothetical protein
MVNLKVESNYLMMREPVYFKKNEETNPKAKSDIRAYIMFFDYYYGLIVCLFYKYIHQEILFLLHFNWIVRKTSYLFLKNF